MKEDGTLETVKDVSKPNQNIINQFLKDLKGIQKINIGFFSLCSFS